MLQVYELSASPLNIVVMLGDEEYLIQTLGETRHVYGRAPDPSAGVLVTPEATAKAAALSLARRETNAALGVAMRREEFYAQRN